jgi:hypothetical protein
VKRGLNPGGPPSKAKYSLVTDSELVPETACLQVVGAPSGVTAYFLHNGPASYSSVARLSDERSRSESESE